MKIPKNTREDRLLKLTPEQKRQLEDIEADAIVRFSGNFDELEAALGMLHLGHHVGWKVLYIIHSKRTIRNYEDILGIKIRDIFKDTGPSSLRSNGYRIVQGFTNFWKAISGEQKIENRREMS